MYVNLQVAQHLYVQNRPFIIRHEFKGRNNSNVNGWSSKWWELRYDGTPGGDIDCFYGAEGAKGTKTKKPYPMGKARTKCIEKEQKGYELAPGTISSVPQVPRAPTPKPTPPPPPPPPKIVLTGPWAEIRTLVRVNGDHYDAYDAGGNLLFALDAEGKDAVVEADPFRITVTAKAS